MAEKKHEMTAAPWSLPTTNLSTYLAASCISLRCQSIHSQPAMASRAVCRAALFTALVLVHWQYKFRQPTHDLPRFFLFSHNIQATQTRQNLSTTSTKSSPPFSGFLFFFFLCLFFIYIPTNSSRQAVAPPSWGP